MNLAERRSRLERLLLDHAPLWQASTFREARPAWCADHPALCTALLALDDVTLDALTADSALALGWLLPMLPALKPLATLTDLPFVVRDLNASVVGSDSFPALETIDSSTSVNASDSFVSAAASDRAAARGSPPEGRRFDEAGARANRDIPGRKVGQIDAFVAAVGKPQGPLVEWCAGKGHLGRRFLTRWGGEALAVERNATLCDQGETLARRVRDPQRFLVADVMAAASAETLRGAHAVALHACGDLHRRLVEAAAQVAAPAIDLAPCCYQLTARETYQPLFAPSPLRLDRNALKLAVTETVTATPRDAMVSAQGSAWKLAFVALREALQGLGYQPFRPVPASWQGDGFAHYLQRLAAREAVCLPAGLDLDVCEAWGWQRHRESRRLQLVRLAFRRAIEVWLLCDLGAWLEKQGYSVELREFCARSLTPRNLLLSARLI